jgi:uncharacterized SAM-binding protein YcdF (DUF218 family)
MATIKDKKKTFLRLLLYGYITLTAFIIICQLLIMYSPLVNTLAKNLIVPPEERQADAIIVLSSGAFNDGSLSHFTLLRTLHGIRLYKNGLAKKIIFSGGNMLRNKLDICISEKMAELASELGVPEDAQLVDNKSLRTYQNALEVKKIMNRYGLKDALLVTSAIHMKRAKLTFEHAGIKVYPTPVSAFETVITDPLDRLGMFRAVMREYVGLLFYKWKGWA